MLWKFKKVNWNNTLVGVSDSLYHRLCYVKSSASKRNFKTKVKRPRYVSIFTPIGVQNHYLCTVKVATYLSQSASVQLSSFEKNHFTPCYEFKEPKTKNSAPNLRDLGVRTLTTENSIHFCLKTTSTFSYYVHSEEYYALRYETPCGNLYLFQANLDAEKKFNPFQSSI